MLFRSGGGRRSGPGILKGNILALLVHPLVVSDEERGKLLGVKDQEGLGDFADRITVRLERVGGDGGRLEFVQRS